MSLSLAGIREYVFPLFVADDPELHEPSHPIVVGRDTFLGTAFFVAKNGIALTAGHCTRDPANLPKGKALIACIWDGQRARAQQVQLATVLDGQDLAILKVSHSPAKFLPVAFERVHMGEDVVSVGVPLHSVSGQAFEYRCLKGNVTFVSKTLELSYPAPRGMSGSPVLRDNRVVGVLSWNARSEALEDQSDEIVEKIGPTTRVTKTVTMSVTNYGQAEPLYTLERMVIPLSEGLPFKELIAKMNRAK